VEYLIQVKGMTMESTKTWEYVVNLLKGFFGTCVGLLVSINFHSFCDNNEKFVRTKNCDAQWGP
jgi:hypothetical protein